MNKTCAACAAAAAFDSESDSLESKINLKAVLDFAQKRKQFFLGQQKRNQFSTKQPFLLYGPSGLVRRTLGWSRSRSRVLGRRCAARCACGRATGYAPPRAAPPSSGRRRPGAPPAAAGRGAKQEVPTFCFASVRSRGRGGRGGPAVFVQFNKGFSCCPVFVLFF